MSTIGVNPLVVGRLPGGTNAWTGVYLAEDIQLLDQGVQNGSWVDATLGGVGTALDALGLITDPLGALVSWGVAWLMEHVKPLSDALDKLAGDPNQIAANVQTWRNVSADLDLLAGAYRTAVSRNAQLWQGPAGEAYLRYATVHHAALDGLAKAAGVMALITEGAGMLVAMVRTLVRDAIAEFVSVLAVRLWEWLAQEAFTLGIGTPWVIAQVSTLVARWGEKIAHFIRGLLNSLRRLAGVLRRLGEIMDNLVRLLRMYARRAGHRMTHSPTGANLISKTRLNHILTGHGLMQILHGGPLGGGHL